MNEDSNTLILHDYPLGLWIAGVFLVIFGLVSFIITPTAYIWLAIDVVLCFLFFLLPTALTITADKVNQVLTLRYRSPVRKINKEIPLGDIESIDLDASHSSDGTTYRIALRCRDGNVIPFRSYYSSGTGAKRKKIEQLQAFLGLPGADGSLKGGTSSIFDAVQAQFQKATVEEKVTDGVRWQMQTANTGNSAINRWFSPDAQFPGGFIFLAQKAVGQKLLKGELMKGVEKMLFPPLLKMYGFGPLETPGVEYASVLSPLDPHLEPHFSAFTNDPAEAVRRLNPWVVNPLEDWAVRYPLKTLQAGQPFGQLIVLFSPQGLYICTMANLFPEAEEELIVLGVQLARAF